MGTHFNLKHGMSRAPEYTAWRNMWARCRHPKHPYFKDYGGRGIAVCDRWKSFEAFLADMGKRPTPRHSLERKDNGKGYKPDKCVWATSAEQCANTRKNRMVEI